MQQINELNQISKQLQGIRPYSADTPYEALIKTVIQQQISYRAANILTMRLISRLSKTHEKKYFHTFPQPREIINLGEIGLREIGLGYKAKYIMNICQLINDEQLNLDSLVGDTYENASSILLPIKGIGKWTVQVLSIAALGDFSTFPYGDLGVQNAVSKLLGKPERISEKSLEEYSESFGKEGPLVLYLIMCADVLGMSEIFSRQQNP